MNYEEEILMMAHKGYITEAEKEKMLTTLITAEIYQRRGL